jgi:hypothetical protein
MIQGKLITLIGWVKQTIKELPAVKSTIYGPASRLIAYSKSNVKFAYPVIHIGRPIAIPHDNEFGHITTEFYLEITCMAKIENSGMANREEDEEIKAEALAMDILLELDRQLRKAAHEDTIDYFAKDTVIEPTFPGYIDKATGFKLVCKIVTGANTTKNLTE